MKKLNMKSALLMLLLMITLVYPTKKADAGIILVTSTGLFGGALWPLAITISGAALLSTTNEVFKSKKTQKYVGLGLLALNGTAKKNVLQGIIKNSYSKCPASAADDIKALADSNDEHLYLYEQKKDVYRLAVKNPISC